MQAIQHQGCGCVLTRLAPVSPELCLKCTCYRAQSGAVSGPRWTCKSSCGAPPMRSLPLAIHCMLRYAVSWLQQKAGQLVQLTGAGVVMTCKVSSFSMRILDYAAGGLAQKAQARFAFTLFVPVDESALTMRGIQEVLKRPDIEKHLCSS